MISRHWKGVARADREADYIRHLRLETIPQLARIPGFTRASILRREVESGIEFQVVTEWVSLEAITAFAGPSVEHAVVPDAVREMMVEYDTLVAHYEVVERLPS